MDECFLFAKNSKRIVHFETGAQFLEIIHLIHQLAHQHIGFTVKWVA